MESAESLTISKNVILLDTADGSSDVITVVSTVPWRATVSPGATWLQIDQAWGTAGSTTIRISVVAANRPPDPATATISFTATNGAAVSPVILDVSIRALNFTLAFHKALGGTTYESPGRNSMVRTADGGMVIAATTNSRDGDLSGNRGGYDIWVVKLDRTGEIVWSKTFGGSGDDQASSIIVTPNGDIEVAGHTNSQDGDITNPHGGVGSDAWVIKLNANGEKLWAKTFGGTRDDAARTITATPDGGSAIAGYTTSIDGDAHSHHGLVADVWVIRLNAQGDTLWTGTYGGSSWDEAGHIISTPDGGLALTGLTFSNDGDVTGYHIPAILGADVWVLKLSARGEKIWAKTLGGSADDVGQSIIAANGGGYIITAYAQSNDGDITGHHGNALFNDIWVAKLNDNGNMIWSKAYGGNLDDAPTAMIADGDGGYIIAGGTDSKDGDLEGDQGSDYNMCILKIDNSGNFLWSKKFGSSGDDVFYSLVADGGNGYLLAGVTNTDDGDISGSGYHGDYDVWVARLLVR